jgi:putative ABC transport system permease protein
MSKHLTNFQIALEALQVNKFKSALTALGIFFGVAAVIIMMGIGKGAKQEILDQMKYIGVNNIWVQNNYVQSDVAEREENSNNLAYTDFKLINKVLASSLKNSTILYKLNTYLQYKNLRKPVLVNGVNDAFFSIFNFEIFQGTYFNNEQANKAAPVCIISSKLASELFSIENPLHKYVKCNNQWLMVIGVYKSRSMNLSANENNNIEFSENDIYVPVKTMLLRFGNSAIPTLQESDQTNMFMPFQPMQEIEEKEEVELPYFEGMILQFKETNELKSFISVIQNILTNKHKESEYIVYAPELILQQQQRTKDIFNIVLGLIAGISLLVGGIGIMNIMYASVMERMREIGTRMALGASDKDILEQFLIESVIISFSGGISGIAMGIVFAKLITQITGILTIVSLVSVLLASIISIVVGIVFGIAPARNAAKKDPIESLKYF